MQRRHLVLCAIALLATACSDTLPVDPTADWTAARARWSERGPSHYTYESRSACFCIVNVTFWHRVEVRDGRVIAVTPLETFPFPGSLPLTTWQTIPELFERARPAEQGSFVVERTVEFDPVLGYPRRIAVRCGPQIADCDNTVEARNLVAIGVASQ